MSALINTSGIQKKARKIDEATWELHRCTIMRLYMEKELEGENGLINLMTKNCKFTARYVAKRLRPYRTLSLSSKSQYESRFRRWGLRKNLKRKDWRGVIEHIKKREKEGKHSEIRLNGALIPKERISRECSRYGWTRDSQIETPEGNQGTLHHLAAYISFPGISSCLPEDVTICTPPSVYDEDEVTWVPHHPSRITTPNQNRHHERQYYSNHMTGISTGLWQITTYGLKPLREQFQPFSWLDTLGWKLFPESLLPSRHSGSDCAPTSIEIAAMFFPNQEDVLASKDRHNGTTVSGTNTILKYSIASFLNKSISFDADTHRWLREIPWPFVARIFGALPDPIKDVFRERMFAEAIKNDNEILARAMLELEIDPLERINIDGEAVIPPRYALHHGKLSVVRVMILHLSKQGAIEELESLLPLIIKTTDRRMTTTLTPPPEADAVQLIHLVLSLGAKATRKSFNTAARNIILWEELVRAQKNGVHGWLRTGFFVDCIRSLSPNSSISPFFHEGRSSIIEWVMWELLRTNAEMGSVIDDEATNALSSAFELVVNASLIKSAQVFFETCIAIKVKLLYPMNEEISGNEIVMQACRSMDRNLLQRWIDTRSLSLSRSPPQKFPWDSLDLSSSCSELCPELLIQAVLNDDLGYIENALRSEQYSTVHRGWKLVFKKAARLGRDRIAIAIIRNRDSLKWLGMDDLGRLLEHGRIHPVSEHLCTDPQVRQALCSATTGDNYNELNDLLRRRLALSKSFAYVDLSSWIYTDLRGLLTALSYHAIYHNDNELLSWLLESSLGTEITFPWLQSVIGPLPPLLGIATAHNKTSLMKYLLEEHSESHPSFALSWAVQNGASNDSIKIVLDEPDISKVRREARKSSTTLLQAVRLHNYELIHLLAKLADVNHVTRKIYPSSDQPDEDFINLSPLGMAIIRQDLKATTLLLENGGDPNKIAAFEKYGIRDKSPDGATLELITGILAAIHTKNLPMVQLLVQGQSDVHKPPRPVLLANLNQSPRLGILRTPLQRAAETGCFDIVQFLVEQGAEIDFVPCYGGGTALQLAAMQGHVGVATFLLERGADPNYLPAKGPGRTAFEAAAEWNRIDMMSLLMKWGCRLEMDIPNDPDERYYEAKFNKVGREQYHPPTSTQYERATRFATNRGHMACKRFIEHLYQECTWLSSKRCWDPESFTNAEQDLDWDAEFWREYGLEI
jgi:ankyrin repeat protein